MVELPPTAGGVFRPLSKLFHCETKVLSMVEKLSPSVPARVCSALVVDDVPPLVCPNDKTRLKEILVAVCVLILPPLDRSSSPVCAVLPLLAELEEIGR